MQNFLMAIVMLFSQPAGAPANIHPGNLPIARVGDKAPLLSTVRWIKGDSVREFQKGKIYLVELGFIACAPCRASIPHLTAIANKYKGVIEVIAINIWENNKEDPADLSYIGKVQKFVQTKGAAIAYSVGVDTPEQTTADTWGGGAPKVFIIDKDQTIVWIGHPQYMDTIIEKILANNFDSRGVADKQLAAQKILDERFDQPWKDKDSGNYKKALEEMDSLISGSPDLPGLYMDKYRLLDGMYAGNAQRDALAVWLIKTKPANFDMYKFAHEIMNSQQPNYNLIIEAANLALKTSTYYLLTACILDVKAEAYFKKGNRAAAVAIEKKAVATIIPLNKEMREEQKVLRGMLKYFQTGKLPVTAPIPNNKKNIQSSKTRGSSL